MPIGTKLEEGATGPKKPLVSATSLQTWLGLDTEPAAAPVASSTTTTPQSKVSAAPAEDLASNFLQSLKTVGGGTDRTGAFQTLQEQTAEKVEAEKAAELQLERDKARDINEDLLGLNQPSEKPDTYRMTQEEYLALSPKQRAAIDFNTALNAAVRRDRKNQARYNNVLAEGEESSEASTTMEQRDTYDADVRKMFGEDRGSSIYAPETVALLKDIGYTNDSADLDDFLSMKLAVTDDDLGALRAKKADDTNDWLLKDGTKVDSPRFSAQNELVTRMRTRIEEVLAKGENLLGNTTATLTQARSDELARYGGISPTLKLAPGYDPANPATEQFQAAFQALSDKSSDLSADMLRQVNEKWQGMGINPDAFWTYAESRLNETEASNGTLGSNAYKPDELRQLLGLKSRGE